MKRASDDVPDDWSPLLGSVNHVCQIAPNSDPLSRPITTPSDGAMTGAAEPTQRSKPVLAGGEC